MEKPKPGEWESLKQLEAIQALKVPLWMQIAIATSGIGSLIYIISWILKLI